MNQSEEAELQLQSDLMALSPGQARKVLKVFWEIVICLFCFFFRFRLKFRLRVQVLGMPQSLLSTR